MRISVVVLVSSLLLVPKAARAQTPAAPCPPRGMSLGDLLKLKPLADWGSASLSVEGLAKRHNTLAFLHALAFAGRAGGDEAGKAIAALADKAATQIIGG